MIHFTCPHCRKNLKAPAGVAGRAIRCPRCEILLEIPVVFQGGAPPARSSPVLTDRVVIDVEPEPMTGPPMPIGLVPGELPAELPVDVPYGPPALVTLEWESPERPSKTGLLVVSLAIVAGLFLLILLIVVLRTKGPDEPIVVREPGPRVPHPAPLPRIASQPAPPSTFQQNLEPALPELEPPRPPHPDPRDMKPKRKPVQEEYEPEPKITRKRKPIEEEYEPEPVIPRRVPSPPKDPIPAPPPNQSSERLNRLIKDLKSNSEADRIKAAQAIGEMGEEARDARQPLCDALRDPRFAARTAVAAALEKVDALLHKPVLTLVVDKDHARHLEALRSLAALREEGKPAVSLVLAYGREAVNAARRQYGVDGTIGDLPNGAALIQTLVAIAPDDKRVLTVLTSCLLRSKNPSAKVQAARGLARTSLKKEAVKALITSLKADTLELVRAEAAQALGELGPDAKDAVKSLEAAKIDPSAQVREAADAALRKIKED